MSYRRFRLAGSVAVALTLVALVPRPARADFLDDARRTFQTDIPHFFQDDIPCAFGGQPTSHTKATCKSSARPVKSTQGRAGDPAAVPLGPTPEIHEAPPSSSR